MVWGREVEVGVTVADGGGIDFGGVGDLVVVFVEGNGEGGAVAEAFDSDGNIGGEEEGAEGAVVVAADVDGEFPVEFEFAGGGGGGVVGAGAVVVFEFELGGGAIAEDFEVGGVGDGLRVVHADAGLGGGVEVGAKLEFAVGVGGAFSAAELAGEGDGAAESGFGFAAAGDPGLVVFGRGDDEGVLGGFEVEGEVDAFGGAFAVEGLAVFVVVVFDALAGDDDLVLGDGAGDFPVFFVAGLGDKHGDVGDDVTFGVSVAYRRVPVQRSLVNFRGGA